MSCYWISANDFDIPFSQYLANGRSGRASMPVIIRHGMQTLRLIPYCPVPDRISWIRLAFDAPSKGVSIF